MNAHVATAHEMAGGSIAAEREPTHLLPQLLATWSSALRRRWLLAASIGLMVLCATAAVLLLVTPVYTAVAVLKIDPAKSNALGELAQGSSLPDQLIVETEVDQIKSLAVAREVVSSLELTAEPVFSILAGADAKLSLSPGERKERLAALLLSNMDAVRRPSTYLVEIRYRSTDAALSAQIANAFATEYLKFSVRQRVQRASEQASMIDNELRDMGNRAAEAQQRLADYRAGAGVISSSGGADLTVADRQLAALTIEQATAQSEAAASAARLRAAEAQLRGGGTASVSAVLRSDVIARLREQRAKLIERRDDINVRYGPLHPQSQIAQSQLASLDGQIRDESERIIGSLRSDAASASARAQSLAAEITALERQRASEMRGSAYAELFAQQAESAQASYDRLAQSAELSRRAMDSPASPAVIVARADTPSEPSAPNRQAVLAAGLVLAPLLAVAVVALAEALSTSFTSLADVQRLGLSALGSVQKVRPAQIARHVGAEGTPADLLVACPFSSYTESLRTTATSFVLPRREKVFAIASSLPDEGKSTVALSLARSLALGGWRVLAVDADLRRGGLTKMAGIRAQTGLVELLQGTADLAETIVPDMATRLDIVPVASPFTNIESPFGDQAMALLLAQMRVNYDVIILDTPPIIGLADGRMLARLADRTALVIRWNATPQSAVTQAIDILGTHSVNLAGVILSMVGRTSDAYGGQHFSRKYRHYYQAL